MNRNSRLKFFLTLVVLMVSTLHAPGVDRLSTMVSAFRKDPLKAQYAYSKKNPLHAVGVVTNLGITMFDQNYIELENGWVIVYLERPLSRGIRLGTRVQVVGRVRGWSPLLGAVVIDGYVR